MGDGARARDAAEPMLQVYIREDTELRGMQNGVAPRGKELTHEKYPDGSRIEGRAAAATTSDTR